MREWCECPSFLVDKTGSVSLKVINTQNCYITTASLHIIIELASHPLSPLAHGSFTRLLIGWPARLGGGGGGQHGF